MRRVGEAVDDGDRGVRRELVHLCLVERADGDRAQEPRKDERRVTRRLTARELEVRGRDVERHAAGLGYADLGADARARRRLAEDKADSPAGQDPQLPPARALDLQLVREVERRPELVGAPVRDPGEAPALERLGDPSHGAITPTVSRHRADAERGEPAGERPVRGGSRAAQCWCPRSTSGRRRAKSLRNSICAASPRARSRSRSPTTTLTVRASAAVAQEQGDRGREGFEPPPAFRAASLRPVDRDRERPESRPG